MRWCLVAVVGASSVARAEILFSNFGPGNTYLGNAGWTLINGGPLQAHVEDAARFGVASGAFSLTGLDLAVSHLFGPNVLHVYIHADASGLPGPLLEQVTVVDQMPTMPTKPNVNPPPVHVALSGSTVLQAGGLYWIHLSTETSTDSWAAWNENITGDLGLRADRWDEGPWTPHTGNPRGAFRIYGTEIPGPGGVIVLAGGVLAALRRRR